jgi:hypothetical protein
MPQGTLFQRVLPALCALALTSGCDEKPSLPEKVIIQGAQVDEVLVRVKKEIGWFLYDGIQVKKEWPQLLTSLGQDGVPVTPKCGNGYVQFNVTSIAMEFNATSDTTDSAKLGLKIPFGPVAAGAKVGPELSASTQRSINQKISYLYKPPSLEDFEKVVKEQISIRSPEDFAKERENAVILSILNLLRDGLIRATQHYPCFKNLDPNDADQKLTLSLGITRNEKAGGEINFYVISGGASHDVKSTGQNQITVSFRPTRASSPQMMVR